MKIAIFKTIRDCKESAGVLQYEETVVCMNICEDQEVQNYFKSIQEDLKEIGSQNEEYFFTTPIKSFKITKDIIEEY